jgi:hypothetical protein
MKTLIFALSSILIFMSTAQAASAPKTIVQTQNFNDILQRIEASNWTGNFKVTTPFFLEDCSGPLDVHFFPLQEEEFSNGAQTVSYRHHADFSKNRSMFCRKLAAKLSPVNVGECKNNFPMKYNPDEGRQVPFRTIIPRQNGTKAFVNSPTCSKDQSVKRQELELIQAKLSEGDTKLELTIRLVLLRQTIDLNYVLYRKR